MVNEHAGVSYIENASTLVHDGLRLAFVHDRAPDIAGEGLPGLFFLPGFGSDMTGTKAGFLRGFARARGASFTSLDYSGHGRSEGRLRDGDLRRWLGDALAVFDYLGGGTAILVGSSMGGWLALHMALMRPDRVQAVIGIAAAPDFTCDLILPRLTPDQRLALDRDGAIELPSGDGPAQVITRALIESGQMLRLLGGPIALTAPVRLIHGCRDRDVPWNTSLRLMDALAGDDVQLRLIKDGDHRLSRDSDLDLLGMTLFELWAEARA